MLGLILLIILMVLLVGADLAHFERTLATVLAQVGEAFFVTLWAEGQALPLEQTLAYALTAYRARSMASQRQATCIIHLPFCLLSA